MTKKILQQLLSDIWNRTISADDAMELIDSELEVTDTVLVYALYIDYREEA